MSHGGDIYNNRIELDFSVNVSPLGVPDNVKDVIDNSIKNISTYPDYNYDSTKKAIADYVGCSEQQVLCTNGASEAFMAIVHSLLPKKAVLIGPGFYGYEHCLHAVKSSIEYYILKEENEFELKRDYLNILTDTVDIAFIGNPNNPTGKYINEDVLMDICDKCYDKSIKLVIDECFYNFSGRSGKVTELVNKYPNVIVVNAFTKICALAGLRVGYIIADKTIINIISNHLPEWNVSLPGAKAMEACVKELTDSDYLNRLHQLIGKEKKYLTEELTKLGIRCFVSDVNFVLIKTDIRLYEQLLEDGILIRDCSDFYGLQEGYYRIAVREHEVNVRLIEAIGKGVLK